MDQDSGLILHSAANFVEHRGPLAGRGNVEAAKTVL
jgi:hypothetical protein